MATQAPQIIVSHTVPGAGRGKSGDDGIIRPAPLRGSFSPGYEHPVQFFSQVAVTSNAEASIRGRALANTLEKTIAIHEIKFVITMTPNVVGVESITQVALGGMISAHLSVGKVPLTNGPVPIWLLGSIYSRYDEDSYGVDSTESTSVYVWKLAKPFHLPPGAQLSARFRHNGLLRQPATVAVAIAGSICNRPPRITAAPFASAFVGTPLDVAAGLVEEAPETALANITGVPLRVDRMMGRAAAHNPQAASGLVPDGIVFSDANHPEVSQLYSVRMVASAGQPIIRDFAPFRSVFPYATGSWECPHTMKPNDFYKLTVQKAEGALENYTWQRGQAFVSIVGSREVTL